MSQTKLDQKPMIVQGGITYTIGEFECPKCSEYHTLHCAPDRKRGKRHWVE